MYLYVSYRTLLFFLLATFQALPSCTVHFFLWTWSIIMPPVLILEMSDKRNLLTADSRTTCYLSFIRNPVVLDIPCVLAERDHLSNGLALTFSWTTGVTVRSFVRTAFFSDWSIQPAGYLGHDPQLLSISLL